MYSYNKLYTYKHIGNSKNAQVEFIFISFEVPVIETRLL